MQKDSAADIELNLKKKARRRLVGAIALVILMMILLPILLKDRTSLLKQEEVKITISSETVVPTSEPNKKAVATDFDSSVVSTEASPSQALVLPNQSQDTEADKKLESQTEVAQLTNQSKEDAQSQSAPKEPEAQAPAEQIKSSADEKESVKKELTPSNPKGTYFVQVGVFSDPENVKKLQAKLNDLGYSSKTEKVATPKGEKIRLKSSTFSTRNEAAIALENIKDAGLTGMVVSQ